MSLLHRILALEAAVPFDEVARTWPVRRQAWADAAVDAHTKRSSPALAKLLAELLALFTPNAVKLYWRKKAEHVAILKATRAIANDLASDPRGEALHKLLDHLYDRIMPKPSKADLKLMSNGKPDHYMLDSDGPTFNKNDRCEALDLRSAWCPAVVISSRRELDMSMHYLVKYDGWGAKWNDWIPQDSGRLRKRATQGAAGRSLPKQGGRGAVASSTNGSEVAAKPAAKAAGLDVAAKPAAKAAGLDVAAKPAAKAAGLDVAAKPAAKAAGLDVAAKPAAKAAASTAPVGARSVKPAGKMTATGRRIAEQAMLAQQQAEAALAKESREAARAASPPLPPPAAPGLFPTVIRNKPQSDPVVPAQKKRPLPPAAAQDKPVPQIARRKEPAAAPQDKPAAAPQDEPTAAPQDEPTAAPQDEPAATPHDEPEVSHRATSAGERRASELRLSSLPMGRRRVWLERLQLMREHLKYLSVDATMFSAAKGFVLRYNKGLQEYVYEMAQVVELDGRVLLVRVLNAEPARGGSEKTPLVRTQVAYVSNSKASAEEVDSLVASLEAGTMADLPLQKVIDMLRILAISLPPTMRREDEPFLRVAVETMDALEHNRPLPDIPPVRAIPQAGNCSSKRPGARVAGKTQDSPSASGAVFSSGRVPDTFLGVPDATSI